MGLIAPAKASDLEIRFCPPGKARTYPLDSTRAASSLLIQGVAIVNRGTSTIPLKDVSIALLRNGVVLDQRTIDAPALTGAARGGKALADSGTMKLIAFQFCDGDLLNGAKLGDDAILDPGEGLMILHQVFAWRGARDAVKVSANDASAQVPIDNSSSKTVLHWPLKGGPWFTAAGPSFHTQHRWARPEEFGLDIVKTGADGRTHRGSGSALTDYYAYNAEVTAAAAGTIAAVISGAVEDPPMIRKPGEAADAYLGRVGQAQFRRLALGDPGIVGESVVIDHGNGEFSTYAHLRPGSILVKKGDVVATGRMIGRLGSSGNSTEPHLHFQLCDGPGILSCSGIPMTFEGIDLPLADGPRPIQSGDVVVAP
jgi:murein DD-endopeptidase MepM/ murein hydrolase activator NlpD